MPLDFAVGPEILCEVSRIPAFDNLFSSKDLFGPLALNLSVRHCWSDSHFVLTTMLLLTNLANTN